MYGALEVNKGAALENSGKIIIDENGSFINNGVFTNSGTFVDNSVFKNDKNYVELFNFEDITTNDDGTITIPEGCTPIYRGSAEGTNWILNRNGYLKCYQRNSDPIFFPDMIESTINTETDDGSGAIMMQLDETLPITAVTKSGTLRLNSQESEVGLIISCPVHSWKEESYDLPTEKLLCLNAAVVIEPSASLNAHCTAFGSISNEEGTLYLTNCSVMTENDTGIENSGDAQLINCTVASENGTGIWNSGQLVMYGANEISGTQYALNNEGGTVTVNDGNAVFTLTGSENGCAIQNISDVTDAITLTGGQITMRSGLYQESDQENLSMFYSGTGFEKEALEGPSPETDANGNNTGYYTLVYRGSVAEGGDGA